MPSDRLTRTLLGAGATAGPLFIATFLVLGARRPDYDPLRHPVSSLGIGPGAGAQVANFAVAGGLYLAGAAGLARSTPTGRTATALVAAAGLGLVGAGVFPTDPISGYPPGTPDAPTEQTRVGTLHDLSSVPVFLGLPVAAGLYARAFRKAGLPRWATGSAVAAAGMVAGFVAASAGFAQNPSLVRFGGLLQRITITITFGWLTALMVRALRG